MQVLMKDIMTPVPVDEVRAVIKKCLENSALINYNKLASEAKVEGQCWTSLSLLFFFALYYIDPLTLCIASITLLQGPKRPFKVRLCLFCFSEYKTKDPAFMV